MYPMDRFAFKRSVIYLTNSTVLVVLSSAQLYKYRSLIDGLMMRNDDSYCTVMTMTTVPGDAVKYANGTIF
jgi:hypothetical protein